VNWFECVPNFSEGRDAAVVDRIVGAAGTGPALAVLDVHSDPDHNRSVVTLAGEGVALVEAVMAMMRVATIAIDLNRQRGVHPRMGATDVVPFVPLGDATTEEAVDLAVDLGTRVWDELGVPVYLYAQAARVRERHELAHVRAGQFEGIRDSIGTDPARRPDIGAARVHPTAGAVAIGARPLLIAFNAYLDTPDVAVARRVAAAVRGRDGGLDGVKALGFAIQGRGRAQVSMNLTDYRRTPPHVALEAVRRAAAVDGASVEETEIVGLVPEDALFDAAEHSLQLNRPARSLVLERKLRAAGGDVTGFERADAELREP
jgi:glutamate formiminotransferase